MTEDDQILVVLQSAAIIARQQATVAELIADDISQTLADLARALDLLVATYRPQGASDDERSAFLTLAVTHTRLTMIAVVLKGSFDPNSAHHRFVETTAALKSAFAGVLGDTG